MRETSNPASAIIDGYGRVADRYAAHFLDELRGKPLDRALLAALAEEVRGAPGRVADLGCGPGQIARHLHDLGVADVVGIDLAPAMIDAARVAHPGVAFEVGDLTALAAPPASLAGLVAFYAIVHLTRAELAPAMRSWCQALAPGAPALVAFHLGDETLRPDDFLGERVDLAWNFFTLGEVAEALVAAGFTIDARLARAPYPSEHPSERGYLLARRPRP